jgi:hypothetical protein
MTHHPDGSTSLVTHKPHGAWSESNVRHDYSATQFHNNPSYQPNPNQPPIGLQSYAEYYPKKDTEILTLDGNNNVIGTTHVGPSGGTQDTINGITTNVPPSRR